MANSIFMSFNGFADQGGGSVSTPGTVTAGGAGGSFYAADGTASLPAYSFTSEPTLGFWRSGAATVTLQGSMNLTGTAAATQYLGPSTGTRWKLNVADGTAVLATFADTIGARFKADALPTVASGFGAAAAIVAGSTPLAGSVNTGAISASGVINFNGTAFPAAPHVIAMNQTTGLAVKAVVSATQLTLSPATGNFAANDIVSWVAISSK